jgi:uncharacterized membrane protein (DUF106 family)
MDPGSNSTKINVSFVPVMCTDMAFGLVIIILTLIATCIFCTIYKIGAGQERTIQVQLNQINEQGTRAPPNTRID